MSVVPVSGRRERELQPLPVPRSMRALGAGGGGGGGGPGLGLSMQGPRGMGKALRELSAEEQHELRRKINSRERKRMQDLNVAMDALREVMVPYSSSSSSSSAPGQHHQQPYLAGSPGPHGGPQAGRRLSKISTLVLARNYILLLASSLQEMRRLLGELSLGAGGAGGGMGVPRVLLTAGGWPLLTSAPTGQLLLGPEALLAPGAASATSSKCPLLPPAPLPQEEVTVWGSSGGAVAGLAGGPLCPCGVCRVPRMVHAAQGPRFPK
ncbi:oligodendrocyte transcription factor 1 [Alosa sapidissima]|uniref:oligodendrocyte transcription factor 1 n=1 Tax=Alosa sapidissima TaxID=34773 RepID=UPI001C099723|nr:oligodendrocyte transcription factor 1 [Alosa sapidissima]